MEFKEVMAKLEELGTAQNRKVSRRHGVKGELFGVSYTNHKLLKKQITEINALPIELWNTGNHDARVLACMIVDSNNISFEGVEHLSLELDNYVVTDAVTSMLVTHKSIQQFIDIWQNSDNDWQCQIAWGLLSHRALKHKDLEDDYFLPYLEIIKKEIHTRLNRTRYSMNNALIAIAGRSEYLREKAEAAAKAIGPVSVDHGETGCKTPDAIPYIAKMWARKK